MNELFAIIAGFLEQIRPALQPQADAPQERRNAYAAWRPVPRETHTQLPRGPRLQTDSDTGPQASSCELEWTLI